MKSQVRAVFKPELHSYRDVIIFSSKGECSLAEKLSGGDFDGDRAWICWDPSIVQKFQNAAVPEEIELKEFGITKDDLKISDILPYPDFTNRFLRHAFDFNLRANMLGQCTVYHEAMCYHEKAISDKSATSIAVLLGLLVDRAKAGIIFDEGQWRAYLKGKKLKHYPKPAYKDREKAQPKNHLIDNLVFKVAKDVREDALGKFARHFQDVGTHDEDLFRPWLTENEEAKCDLQLQSVLYDLKTKLKQIHEFWKLNVPLEDSKETTVKKNSKLTFRQVVERCRDDFLAVKPLALEDYPITKRWKRENEQQTVCGIGYWQLLKASAAYHEWHKTGAFPWYLAGCELGILKASAAGTGSYRVTKMEVYEVYKLDNKAVRRRQEMEAGRAMDDDDDEFGEFDWDYIDI